VSSWVCTPYSLFMFVEPWMTVCIVIVLMDKRSSCRPSHDIRCQNIQICEHLKYGMFKARLLSRVTPWTWVCSVVITAINWDGHDSHVVFLCQLNYSYYVFHPSVRLDTLALISDKNENGSAALLFTDTHIICM